ncbi:uncharacterized protein LOC127106674 isoform X2 [Lathyrus oleraceus]|uniref:Uncharacterized protein n=1 Tax=Pisum sativum TaxID=3888 RepID=A0A9D4ZRD3_PEA|nr:uncharacterized protein LOC127106674 isoform X2 [Pisum sativum]KAI5382447.1 hypothetical protein KIW84_070030 [Pisum sativum]
MAYIKSCISYSALPFFQRRGLPPASSSPFHHTGTFIPQCLTPKILSAKFSKNVRFSIPRSTTSSSSNSTDDDDTINQTKTKKTPFGYSRKDVILIGLGVTFLGIGLKSGLEYVGVDPLQAGNVVQLVLVLGLTIGWISTYIFRVSNKEMTYAQQLRDYESKVMEKRLESLTEAELEVLLQEVEEEKSR